MTFNKLFFIFLYKQWWFVVINLNAEFTALAEHFAFTRNQGNVTVRHSSLNAELAILSFNSVKLFRHDWIY